MSGATALALILILSCAAVFGALVLIVIQGSRLTGKTDEIVGLLGVLSAQASQTHKREKRLVELLEDMRAGRGEESDLARTFSEAEEQKVAFYKLAELKDSPQGVTLAKGVRQTATALYQDIIDRFPGTREAEIAQETIVEFNKREL